MRVSGLLVAGVALLLTGAVVGERPFPERSTSEVLDLLEHPNPAVRIEAADELGRRKAEKALVPLINRLLSDPEPLVRSHAAEALREIGDERAVPFLARALDDPDATTRCRAALALGSLGGRYLVPALTRMLADPAVVVRAAAIRALGEIGDPLSLEVVLAAQKKERVDTDDAVTSAALVAAAQLGGAAGLARSLALAGDKVETSWFVRSIVARAIAIAKDRSRVPWLVKCLNTDDDRRVAEAAAGALATLKETAPLKKAAALPDGFRRRAAVAALADIADPTVVPILVKATRDADPSVVLVAASALLDRGRTQAFPVLIDLLKRENPVWMGALFSLQRHTGLEFGRNPPRWTEWYHQNSARLEFDSRSKQFGLGG